VQPALLPSSLPPLYIYPVVTAGQDVGETAEAEEEEVQEEEEEDALEIQRIHIPFPPLTRGLEVGEEKREVGVLLGAREEGVDEEVTVWMGALSRAHDELRRQDYAGDLREFQNSREIRDSSASALVRLIDSLPAEARSVGGNDEVCCNKLQYTAIHCNTLQHIAVHFNTLHSVSSTPRLARLGTWVGTTGYTATHYNTWQYTATHYDTLQHIVTHCRALQYTAKRCNSLQHIAT